MERHLREGRKWSESLSCVQLSATSWTITVHGVLQARILEWVAFHLSREKEYINLNLPRALESHLQLIGPLRSGPASCFSDDLVRWPGRVKWPVLLHRNSFKEQEINFPKSCRKDVLSETQPTKSKVLAVILCEEGAPWCHHHIHCPWEASRRVLIVLASHMPKPKHWVFSWASIRASEDFSEGSVMGEWCSISSHCGWACSGHTTVETSPASYFIVCWSDGDSYREVCLSQTGRSCVVKGKFC